MSLESRIKRLEQTYAPTDQPLVVLLDWKLSDKVLGMSLGDVPTEEFFVRPTEGESEEQFCGRGAELAKRYVRSSWYGTGVCVLEGASLVGSCKKTFMRECIRAALCGGLVVATALVAAPRSHAGTALEDFQARCNAVGVILCNGFDSAADIAGTYGDHKGTLAPAPAPALDMITKASGTGSLKFTVPANSSGDQAGAFFTNFSRDLSVQFGGNSEFYVQWRQRFSPEFLATGDFKQTITGTGDKPGCTSRATATGLCYASCSALEIVTNSSDAGFPVLYNSCTGSASHGAFDGFYQRFGPYDYKLQNARPAPYCLYSQGYTKPPTFFPPQGNCFGYFPNEWMTFQIHVRIGPRIGGEFTNSHVEMWIAREGKASEQVIDWGPYNLTAGPPAADQRFGKIWLLPYYQGAEVHPAASTWYDELIISRERIPDPAAASPTLLPGIKQPQ